MLKINLKGSHSEVMKALEDLENIYDVRVDQTEEDENETKMSLSCTKGIDRKNINQYVDSSRVEKVYEFPRNTLVQDVKRAMKTKKPYREESVKMKEMLDEGLILFKGRQWLFHKEALRYLYGEPSFPFDD